MSEVGRYKEFLRKASSMGLRDDLEVFSGSSCSNCMMVVSSYTSGVQGVRPLGACSPGITTVIEGRGLRIGVRDRREEFQFWNLVMVSFRILLFSLSEESFTQADLPYTIC